MRPMRHCLGCGKALIKPHVTKRWCSTSCRSSAKRRSRSSEHRGGACVVCSAVLSARSAHGLSVKKYCSASCASEDRRRRRMAAGAVVHTDLSPGTVGAVGELAATIDLVRRGYEVFRAISPSSSCDLLVLKGGRVLRIEVRTAGRTSTGEVRINKTSSACDHFAGIVWSGCGAYEVLYDPPL